MVSLSAMAPCRGGRQMDRVKKHLVGGGIGIGVAGLVLPATHMTESGAAPQAA